MRPGKTISGYIVREAPGGVQIATLASATSTRILGLRPGPHRFTVEAPYSGEGSSGLSTPSHTISLAAPRYRHGHHVVF